MALQRTVKSYPLMRILLAVSVVLLLVGLVASKVVTDPDAGDKTTLLFFVLAAVVLPFAALLFPRRAQRTVELPSEQLAKSTASELEGVLKQLDAAKAKGEISDERYRKARSSVDAALRGKR